MIQGWQSGSIGPGAVLLVGVLVSISASAGAVHGEGELSLLTAGDAGDELGEAVALSNGTALVGAPGAQVDGNDEQGLVHVYTRSDTGWTQQAELTAPDGAEGDRFGAAVDVHEGTAIVGAPSASVGENASQGAAYVFTVSGGDWSAAEDAKLVATEGTAGDAFGQSVAIGEDTAVVGAPATRVDGNLRQGAAYIYETSGGDWATATETRVSADDGDRFDRFGFTAALDEDHLVVGAPEANVDGNDDQGAAYVFTPVEADWATADQTRLPHDGDADDRFGSSMAADAGAIVVGAQRTDVGDFEAKGVAHVFVQGAGGWVEDAELHPIVGQTNTLFGASVAVHGDAIAVGSPQADVDESHNQGDVHLFLADDGSWSDAMPTHVTAEGADLFDRFGSSVALHSDTLLAGAPNADPGGEDAEGTAYLGALHLGGDPPSITIDAVGQEGQPLVPGQPIGITVTAESGGQALSSVEVAVDDEVVASQQVPDDQDPFGMDAEWTPQEPGTYTVTATVTDEAGNEATDSTDVEVGTGEQPELAVLDEVFPPVAIDEPTDGATFAAGDEVAFTGTLRVNSGWSEVVILRLPGDEGILATPSGVDEVTFPGGTAGPFETVTIQTGEGEVSFPGDSFEEIAFPGDSWVEVQIPGDTWEEIRFPGDSFDHVAFPGDTFDTVTVETEDGPVSFPGDMWQEIRFPGDTFGQVSFPGDSFQEIRFPGDSFDHVKFPGDSFQTVTIETESGERSFPGDTFSEFLFLGDIYHEISFPGDSFEEIRFPGDSFDHVKFPGDSFQTVTIETESGERSFPGDTFSEIRFPGDTFDQVKFPGDTFEEIRFPGDTFDHVAFPGDTFQTVTVETNDGPVSFPGDTFTEFQFPGDTFDQVNFPGDTFGEIQFPGDALTEARFSEGSINRMTLSTTGGSSTFPGDTLHQVRFPGDTLSQAQFPGDALDEIQFPGDTLQAEWSASWAPAEPGTHEAEAFVVDDEGNTGSQGVTFTVQETQGSADAPGLGALASALVVGGLALVVRRW